MLLLSSICSNLLSSPFLPPIKRENSFSRSKREAKYHPETRNSRAGACQTRSKTGFLEGSAARSGRVTRIQVSWIEVKFCRVTEDPVLTLGRVENLGTAVCKRLVSDARKGREEVME